MSTGVIALRQTLTGIFDANGNVTMRIAPQDIPMNRYATVRFDLFGSTGAPTFTLVGNGVTLDSCTGYATLGPSSIDNNYLPVQVQGTGGTPGASVSMTLSGWTASDPTQLPDMPSASNVSIVGGNVAITGPVGITGPVTVNQTDPSLLLTGVVGPPLVENQTLTVLANSVDTPLPSAATSYDLAGYGGLYMRGVNQGTGNGFHAQIEWIDAGGNTIDVTSIPDTRSGFQIIVGANARFFRLHFWNLTVTNRNITNLTVIPITSVPANPGALLSSILGTVNAAPQPDPRIMMADDTVNIAGSGSFKSDAFWTYAGRANWNVANSAGVTNGNLYATLDVTFANGTQINIAHAGGVPMQETQEVVLPGGHVSATLHNSGASAGNFDNSLVVA